MNKIYSCHFTRSEAIWWWYLVSDSQLVSDSLGLLMVVSWLLQWQSTCVTNPRICVDGFIIIHLLLIFWENSQKLLRGFYLIFHKPGISVSHCYYCQTNIHKSGAYSNTHLLLFHASLDQLGWPCYMLKIGRSTRKAAPCISPSYESWATQGHISLWPRSEALGEARLGLELTHFYFCYLPSTKSMGQKKILF